MHADPYLFLPHYFLSLVYLFSHLLRAASSGSCVRAAQILIFPPNRFPGRDVGIFTRFTERRRRRQEPSGGLASGGGRAVWMSSGGLVHDNGLDEQQQPGWQAASARRVTVAWADERRQRRRRSWPGRPAWRFFLFF
ncbi:hypothetical protein PVAP13_9NG381670 [Panicum virgatum]|uniref:Uncharacterized protein n=1 Tax=Panicum virgatum TaxID=38727 RepID=A0A8T0MUK2_PANVG|nr:hypothetical protein PVAP13_9NG381670 [Panicum virgatum]